MKFMLVLITNLLLLGASNLAKILSVFPYPGPSQYIFISPLLKALAEKGHDVTSISTFPQKKPLKNFRDIAVMENAQMYDDYTTDAADTKNKYLFEEYIDFAEFGERVTSNIFEVMKTEQFDLIIVEVLMSESLLGLGEYFKAPVVAVSTFGIISFIDYLVGNVSPLSYIPHMSLPYKNPMSVWQRCVNVMSELIDNFLVNYFIIPSQDKVYRKYFPNAKLSLNEARKNVSLVLINDHFTLRQPRPFVPNMIEVGGMHIKQKPEPLEDDLQEFLDNATGGVIYFSMGSNVKSKDLPKEKLRILLETFRELKIKVLWKFELEELPNKPDNVLIRKWFNQPSILAHPNVKLFISHGGYLSTTETIFHAKPILGIPRMADRFMNVKNAIHAGFALSVRLEDMTMESFKATILELWQNPKYTQAVRRLSKRYRDQPLTPLQKAMFWTEYVLRHDGAAHMRNAGQDLSFVAYNNIDVYLLLFLVFVVTCSLLIYLVKLFCEIFSKLFLKQQKRKPE